MEEYFFSVDAEKEGVFDGLFVFLEVVPEGGDFFHGEKLSVMGYRLSVISFGLWVVCFGVVIVDVELQIVQMDQILFFGIGEVCQLDQVDLLVQDVFTHEVL